MENKNHGHKNVFFLLFGFVFGGITALLLAPKSGKETRDIIANKLENKDEIINKTKESAEEIIHKTKDQIENLITNVSKSIDEKIHHKNEDQPEN